MYSLLKLAAINLAVSQGVHAWGELGHATVAYIAQHYLDSDAASWAQNILGGSSETYLAHIASWADQYRETKEGKWSAPLHFIDAEDNPPSSCNVDYQRDCGDNGCSISAIANYTQRVTDSSLSDDEVTEAMKFLVHFIGDLTQPLHDEALELGGNKIKVTFDGYTDNLHADWDTYIPEKKVGGGSLSDASKWSKALVKDIESGKFKSVAGDWIKGDDITNAITTATRWASDANAYVCSVVMPNGASALQQGDLYPTYYDSVIDTVELQIAKGGYRLGNWLNMLYQSQNSGGSSDSSQTRRSEMKGRDFLPPSIPLSRAKMARAAMEGSCCTNHHHH